MKYLYTIAVYKDFENHYYANKVGLSCDYFIGDSDESPELAITDLLFHFGFELHQFAIEHGNEETLTYKTKDDIPKEDLDLIFLYAIQVNELSIGKYSASDFMRPYMQKISEDSPALAIMKFLFTHQNNLEDYNRF